MQVTVDKGLLLVFLSLAEVGDHGDHAVTVLLLDLLIVLIVLILSHEFDILHAVLPHELLPHVRAQV